MLSLVAKFFGLVSATYVFFTGVLVFAALLMLRFDVRLSNGHTQWPMPPTDKSSQAVAMDQPGHDMRPKQKWHVAFSNKSGN